MVCLGCTVTLSGLRGATGVTCLKQNRNRRKNFYFIFFLPSRNYIVNSSNRQGVQDPPRKEQESRTVGCQQALGFATRPMPWDNRAVLNATLTE